MPKDTEFKPTENQQAAVDHLKEQNYECDVRVLCEAIGIHHSTYYEWFKNPDFCAWWAEQASEHFAKELPRVLGAMHKAALESKGRQDAKHNPAAIKLYLERFDNAYKPTSRQEVDVSIGFDEELQRLEAAAREIDSERASSQELPGDQAGTDRPSEAAAGEAR